MRTIEFRGKGTMGQEEWFYSSNTGSLHDRRMLTLGAFWRMVEMSEIDPKTVGEYSGSFCEGDILQAEKTHVRVFRRVVGFRQGQFGYEQPDYPGSWYPIQGRGSTARWLIIGNIHDNPELMEAQQ